MNVEELTNAASKISAVFLQGQSYENDLNVHLSVPSDLSGDVKDLSGCLGFNLTEIGYIMNKNYPFVYMLDQWIKRVGSEEATLDYLYKYAIEIERPDAAEIIEKAILDLSLQDPEKLDIVSRRHNSKLKRTESNVSLCPSFPRNLQIVDDGPPPEYSVAVRNSNYSPPKKRFSLSNVLTKNKNKSCKGVNEDAPSVYVVYVTDNDQHLKLIRKMVENLRNSRIDARSDEFESIEASQNQGYHIYSKLIEAEYVIVVCSAAFENEGEDTEQGRKAMFILKLILDFVYENGPYNSKYIPVLLPDTQRKHVPFVLRGSQSYDMNKKEFNDDLVRRIFKIEKYVLSELPKTRPKLKPINIADMFN